MLTPFVMAELTASQLNEIVMKLGGVTGALQFLRGETVVVPRETITGTTHHVQKEGLAKYLFSDATLIVYGMSSSISRNRLLHSLQDLSVNELAKMTDDQISELVHYKFHRNVVVQVLKHHGLR